MRDDMLRLFQLQLRDLLWLTLLCCVVASYATNRSFVEIDSVIHSPIYIAGDDVPPQIDSDRYIVHIRGARGWHHVYEPTADLKARLDHLSSDTVPEHLHLAPPNPSPPPGQSAP